jgi:hypothetical protein
VRRLFGWTAGLVGIAALARLLAARQARVEAPAPRPPSAPDPADELRRKLAETREDPDAAGGAAERPPEREPLEERRARVHAKAQEALAAMDALEEPPS